MMSDKKMSRKIVKEAVEPKPIMNCPGCGQPMTGTLAYRRYCSDRCRRKIQTGRSKSLSITMYRDVAMTDAEVQRNSFMEKTRDGYLREADSVLGF